MIVVILSLSYHWILAVMFADNLLVHWSSDQVVVDTFNVDITAHNPLAKRLINHILRCWVWAWCQAWIASWIWFPGEKVSLFWRRRRGIWRRAYWTVIFIVLFSKHTFIYLPSRRSITSHHWKSRLCFWVEPCSYFWPVSCEGEMKHENSWLAHLTTDTRSSRVLYIWPWDQQYSREWVLQPRSRIRAIQNKESSWFTAEI